MGLLHLQLLHQKYLTRKVMLLFSLMFSLPWTLSREIMDLVHQTLFSYL